MMAFLENDSNEWQRADADNSPVADDDQNDNVDQDNDSRDNDGRKDESKSPAGQDYLSPVTQEKSVKRTTILLSALFIVGLLCLWFMISKSTPQAANAQASDDNLQIETAIAQATGIKAELFSGMDDIVKKFSEFSQVNQVAVAELEKAPFKHEKFYAKFPLDTDSDLDESGKNGDKQLAMQLKSIMQTQRGNCCMVNDSVLYKGDYVNGYRVIKIGESHVELLSGDSRVILTIARDVR